MVNSSTTDISPPEKKGTVSRPTSSKRSGPERTCSGCRKKNPSKAMIRIVRDHAGRLVVDYYHKLPGRGAYVCPSAECIKAASTGGFSRAFKSSVVPPEGGYESLVIEIVRRAYSRALNLVGLHRKAGMVASGGDACLRAMTAGGCQLVILARDLSERRAHDMINSARKMALPLFRIGSMEELGRALGRSPVGIVGVGRMPGDKGSGLTSSLEIELTRVETLLGPDDNPTSEQDSWIISSRTAPGIHG